MFKNKYRTHFGRYLMVNTMKSKICYLILFLCTIMPIYGAVYEHNISIYGSPSCHVCHETGEFFMEEDMPYTFYDVGDPENLNRLLEYYKKAGIDEGITIPTIIIDDKWLVRGGLTIGDVRYIKSTKTFSNTSRIRAIACDTTNDTNNINNTNITNNTYENNSSKKNATTNNDQTTNLPYLFMLTGLGEIINPCSWAVYLYFISFVIAESTNRRSILKYGIGFILSAYILYGMIAFGFINLSVRIPTEILYNILAVIAVVVGLIKIYEGLKDKKILAVSKKAVKNAKVNTGMLGSIIGGALYALLLSPCVIPGYAIASSLMSKVSYPWIWVLIYNLIILLPPIFITLFAYFGMNIEYIKELRDKKKNLFKIIIGMLLLLVGILLKVYF